MRRIPEAELVLPTLMLLHDAPNGEMTTTELIRQLEYHFLPDGEDAAILADRTDTKFSQKVRNLKSHKTLSKAGLAEEIPNGFRVTEKGRIFVESFGEQ